MPLILKKQGPKPKGPFKPKPTTEAEAPTAAPWDDPELGPENHGEEPEPPKKSKLAGMAKPPAQKAEKPAVSGLLKKGKAAQQTLEVEAEKAEAARKSRGLYRWFMKAGESKPALFLDGDLDSDGLLDVPFVYEHQMYDKHAQIKFKTYLCTQDVEPCPICEQGDTPQYIGYLTVIDLNGYIDKDGKHHATQKRLMPVKRDTFKQLQMMATKRGGLRGCVFDISRVGDKSASVGSNFDFTQKLTPEELVEELGEELAAPIDYEEMIGNTFLSAAQLRVIGMGSAPGVGSETDPSSYDDKL